MLGGARIARAAVNRQDVVRGPSASRKLLSGQAIASVERHGKQLALVGDAGGCVSVHLGMSGRLEVVEKGSPAPPHTHVVWTTEDSRQLRFIDPRRFGGVWTHRDIDDLRAARWSRLGPDAATITAAQLRTACGNRTASIKSVLLNQHLIAGIGNIYADESLFGSRISPQRPAGSLTQPQHAALARHVRRVLAIAIRAGGSTIRDYRTPDGERGSYTAIRLVYGRAGEPCPSCGAPLASDQTASRTTVWCPICQQ